MSGRAIKLLRRRIRELDDSQLPIVSFHADRRLLHFIEVMSAYTNTSMAMDLGGRPVLVPAEADDATNNCRLLVDIAQDEKDLVDGPLQRTRQQWIGTGRHTQSSAETPTPAQFRLNEARATDPISTKPFDIGLYTSTAAGGGRGMWRTYLNSVGESDIHPLPWYTWDLQIARTSAVAEIASACDWVDFVGTYPRQHAGMVYPDWRAVATDVDGVHLTLRAIAAIQGFSLSTIHGPTAAAYWDVESTLWLRWCFSSVKLRDVTDDASR